MKSASIRLFCFVALLVGVALGGNARAAGETMQAEAILARQQAIAAGVDAGTGRYARLNAVQKKSIRADQQDLADLLKDGASMDSLSASQRRKVARLVNRIDEVVADANGERMVCTQETRIGSNYLTRVCRTPEQIQSEKDAGDKLLREQQQRPKCNERIGCG